MASFFVLSTNQWSPDLVISSLLRRKHKTNGQKGKNTKHSDKKKKKKPEERTSQVFAKTAHHKTVVLAVVLNKTVDEMKRKTWSKRSVFPLRLRS